MWLYLILNIASFIIPFIYSFEKKMYYAKRWKAVLPSILMTAIVYIVWDMIFTHWGVWSFNPRYHSGIHIINLPIEECLFFICIPYASIFIHYAFQYFFPTVQIGDKLVTILYYFITIFSAFVILFNTHRLYTAVNLSLLIIILSITYFNRIKILKTYFLTFLIILIPFLIVNGILTGSFIDEPVVLYNNAENLGIRLGTIPIEDIGYAFSMLLMSIYLIEFMEKKQAKAYSTG